MKDAQATEDAFCPQREHPAIQNIKFLYFFLFLWVIFALLRIRIWNADLDPDPATQINADPCGYGFATLNFFYHNEEFSITRTKNTEMLQLHCTRKIIQYLKEHRRVPHCLWSSLKNNA